jgi:SHS family sialic acid transporter-like MFS transporter
MAKPAVVDIVPGPVGKPHEEAPVGRAAYLALAAALLGWMFDGAEMGVFSLVGQAAVKELLNTTNDYDVRLWIAVINAGFLIGAATGGVLFGWLGDRIGRVRAMTLSVLTYALFTGACGMAQEAWQVGGLRFIAALGMGGEWSLGVALVMEVWPNRSRAFMAGLIGAAANVGYLMVGVIGLILSQLIGSLLEGLQGFGYTAESARHLIGDTGWRLIMVLGTLPALLTFFIRTFVPESKKWEKEQASGSTSHWAASDLLAVLIGAAGPGMIVWLWATPGNSTLLWVGRIVGTVVGLAMATIGYSYPALRYCQRLEVATGRTGLTRVTIRRMLIAACLSGVALLGTWGSTQNVPNWIYGMVTEQSAPEIARLAAAGDHVGIETLKANATTARGYALIAISAGAILGTMVAAFMGNWFGRRMTYVLMCGGSLVSIVYLFAMYHQYSNSILAVAFVTGACTAAFYGWLPLYLPELFVTSVRATGQGFGFNFGRVLAAIGALQMTNLLEMAKGRLGEGVRIGEVFIAPGWPVLCCLLSTIYLLGMGIIWLAPETKGQALPE